MPTPSPSPARESAEQRYFRLALLVALWVTAFRLLWLAANQTDLYPDEAQYWLWSRSLDWGYFSKPPLIAWIIAATTAIFGDGTFGIRVAAPVLHCGTALLVFAIARRLYDPRVACWAAVSFVTLPAISVSSGLISTDVPLLFCWAAALYALIRAREEERWSWWLLAGAATGLGLLAKYAMAYWLVAALAFLLLRRGERRHLFRFAVAAALAFLIYAPNLAWNLAHGLASYRHTEANANLGGTLFHARHFAEFAASQFGVFGPLLFATLIGVVVAGRRFLAEKRGILLAFFSLPILVLMLALSFLSRAQANWAAPAYVAATPLVVAALLALGWRRLLALSLALHLAFAAFLLVGPELVHAAGYRLPSKLDPWNRLRGWAALGRAVSELRLRYPNHLLLGDDRELMAALVYYVQPHPFDIQEWNPTGHIGDHFALTTDLERHRGADFLFVTEAETIPTTEASFDSVARIATIVVPRGPDRARRYNVFEMRGFKGYR